VIYVPEGFEVREGLKLTEDYKVTSLHCEPHTIPAAVNAKGSYAHHLCELYPKYKWCSQQMAVNNIQYQAQTSSIQSHLILLPSCQKIVSET